MKPLLNILFRNDNYSKFQVHMFEFSCFGRNSIDFNINVLIEFYVALKMYTVQFYLP